MKQVKKNPSRLRPFDQQDRNYFEKNKPKTFDECIEDIVFQLDMVKCTGTNTETVKKEQGMLSSESVATFARISRIHVRDLKVYVNQLMEHLEKIEMKGEWK